MDIEADDRATPTFTSVGRSIAVLGSTLGIVTRDLGIHNAALDAVIRSVQVLGAGVRALGAVQRLLALANQVIAASNVELSATDVARLALIYNAIGATEAETAANYGLAASFAAVNAAMGPLGWGLLAAGIVGAGLVGYAAGGGGRATTPTAPAAGAIGETTNIYIGNANMQTRKDATETATALATIYHHSRRRYGR